MKGSTNLYEWKVFKGIILISIKNCQLVYSSKVGAS